jgi:hypothetical protein
MPLNQLGTLAQGIDPSGIELFLHSQSVHSLIEVIVAFALTRFRQTLHF